jgi:uncharacterized protein YcfJ
MKKIILLLIVVLLSGAGQTQARDNGLNGLLFGAGSGAIIGQAIGHNTGGTLIGTAVGSMFGYMIGNEMDKNGVAQYRTVYRTQKIYRPVPHRQVRRYPASVRHYEEPIIYGRAPVCRNTRMLATIDGEAEEVIGTACLEDGQWRMQTTNVNIAQTTIYRDDDDWRWRRMHRHGRRHHRRD